MTISNGNVRFDDAGGIANEDDGTLTVTRSTIRGNTASGGGGGGISNFQEGTLTVTDSTISGNSAGNFGGGIANGGGPLTVTGSTISGNTASGCCGGGIYSSTDLSGPKATITNSTISGNTAGDSGGGGIYNVNGLTVIEFSTITNNTAPNDQGSGVASLGDDTTRTEVLSSIISANTNTDVDFINTPNPVDTNSFVSGGYNLIGDGNATGAFNQTGDQTGVTNPKLAHLRSYGGLTKTIRLLPGSPAVSVIPEGTNGCGTEITTDQRGVTRPQGPGCDIGAFEKKRHVQPNL